jgi:hypothetical protein
MDVTPMVVAMLKPLLWLLPLLVVSGVVKSPWFKGWLGERKVRNLLGRHLDPSVYREFHNLTVRDAFGDTTQIDHVYVSRYGVFVLETKHLGHWIFGGRHQPQWTQQIFRHKVKFQNPLRQNYRHIKVLASLLDLPDEAFRSVVVFTGDCTFKTERPEEVRTCADLVGYLRSFGERTLTDEQVGAICLQLQRSRLEPSWSTHRQHMDSLRLRHGAVPSIESSPSRSRAEAFAEVAGERLLRAVEDRIRNDGRHRVSRAVQFGLAAIAGKALAGLAALLLIWWVFTTVVGNAVRPLRPTQVVATPAPVPAPDRMPATAIPVESTTPEFDDPLPQPVQQRRLTARELAEERRQAEETMRILERSTPEIPLALPGSPAVGPAAYPASDNRTATDGQEPITMGHGH